MDAPGHVYFEGRSWGGRRVDDVARDEGLAFGSIAPLGERGIVTRGVLLDVAAARGVAHLRPGDGIGVADLEAAERLAGVTRRSRGRDRRPLGPWRARGRGRGRPRRGLAA